MPSLHVTLAPPARSLTFACQESSRLTQSSPDNSPPPAAATPPFFPRCPAESEPPHRGSPKPCGIQTVFLHSLWWSPLPHPFAGISRPSSGNVLRTTPQLCSNADPRRLRLSNFGSSKVSRKRHRRPERPTHFGHVPAFLRLGTGPVSHICHMPNAIRW